MFGQLSRVLDDCFPLESFLVFGLSPSARDRRRLRGNDNRLRGPSRENRREWAGLGANAKQAPGPTEDRNRECRRGILLEDAPSWRPHRGFADVEPAHEHPVTGSLISISRFVGRGTPKYIGAQTTRREASFVSRTLLDL